MVPPPNLTTPSLDHVPDRTVSLIHARIAACPGEAAFRSLLLALMSQPGRVLADPGRAKWPAFVTLTCAALGGEPCAAAHAAAAVEFAVAAIDVADDVVDGDQSSDTLSGNRAVNASLALSWLAQRCATSLVDILGADRAERIGRLLAEGSLGSCAGQDFDLALEGCSNPGEVRSLAMTSGKSGSLVSMACQVGAAIATEDRAILDLVGRFGTHVGVVAQLLNDLVDVDPLVVRGNDLRRHKRTLPIA